MIADDERGSILIVDDDDRARGVIANLLTEHGYQAVGASSANEALALLRRTAVPVLVLEIGLPAMDGMELLATVRSQYRSVRVVVLSRITDQATIAIVKERGAAAYLTKPCTAEALTDAIQSAMAGPIVSQPPGQETASLVTSERPTEPRVLVLDDDRDTRRLVCRTLSNRGYRVVEAETGDEAILKLSRGSFHVAILDIKMPGLDGLDVLIEMADLSPQTVPIMLTGAADKDSVQAAVAGRASGYIIKPCRPSDLIAAVERAVRQWGNRDLSGVTIVHSRGQSILVVDDDKHVRKNLVRSLEREGYEAVEAAGGADALFKLSQQHFAVVLLDVKMPGMDGVEVLHSIVEHHPNTFVIMLTGLDPADRDEAAILSQLSEDGAYGCLQKPCRIDELIRTIDGAFKEESGYWREIPPPAKTHEPVSKDVWGA